MWHCYKIQRVFSFDNINLKNSQEFFTLRADKRKLSVYAVMVIIKYFLCRD